MNVVQHQFRTEPLIDRRQIESIMRTVNDRKNDDKHWSSGVKGNTATFKLTRVQPLPQDVRRKIEQRKLQARMLHARSAGPSQRPHGSTALPRKPSAAAEVAPLSPPGAPPPTTTLQVRLANKTDRFSSRFSVLTPINNVARLSSSHMFRGRVIASHAAAGTTIRTLTNRTLFLTRSPPTIFSV